MKFQVDKRPTNLEFIMNEDNKITEEVLPKPQVTRTPRLSRKREITFTEPIPTNAQRMAAANLEVGEEAGYDDLDDGMEQKNKTNNIRFEIANCELSRKVAKLQILVNNSLKRLKQERLKHEQVTTIMMEKSQAYEDEHDQQTIKLKISKESEAETKVKYLTMKSNYFKAHNQNSKDKKAIANLTESNTNLEREVKILEARITGLESRGQGGGSPGSNEAQLGEQVHLQEILQQSREKEAEEYRDRIIVLEDGKDGDQRLLLALERSTVTMKLELKRLNKTEVQYQKSIGHTPWWK